MDLSYLTDRNGSPVAVVVPVDEWETICARLDKQAEEETSYLLKSPVMRERLAQARLRKEGKTMDEVHRVLGL